MKHIFLALSLVLVLMPTDVFAASANLPVTARIINLTTMPIEEAISYCDERNLACPSLREKNNSAQINRNPLPE
jgi:hypothetical protein